METEKMTSAQTPMDSGANSIPELLGFTPTPRAPEKQEPAVSPDLAGLHINVAPQLAMIGEEAGKSSPLMKTITPKKLFQAAKTAALFIVVDQRDAKGREVTHFATLAVKRLRFRPHLGSDGVRLVSSLLWAMEFRCGNEPITRESHDTTLEKMAALAAVADAISTNRRSAKPETANATAHIAGTPRS